MTGWAVAAFALYVGWAGAAFGVRAVLQHRRTGDAGFRGVPGRPGTAAWWAGVLFVLALLGGAAAPLGTLAGLPELPGTRAAPVQWTGLGIALAGIAATFAAQTAMGASWRVGVDAGERTELVTAGLFAHVRNPVFTAMTVTAAGLGLMTPNLIAVTALAGVILAVQSQVRAVEEPCLRSVHGAAYATYSSRAGRFLPGIGRRRIRGV
ncbi:methyltransferase family protein [Streptomyces sp. OE57]|uniref:methyltransferase family protein n=1 Tax=Streptomyces lacaronensis TaxID=3379885 RepID=UPI0039B761FB